MQEQNYSIREWAKDDRPREKLLSKGPANLSNSELLALLIHKGRPGSSAVAIAQEVLRLGQDNLNELAKKSVSELMQVRGIGEAKAVAISAALELGRRRQIAAPLEKKLVTNSQEVAGHLQTLLRDYRHEVFAVIYLNRGNRINHFEIISEGGLTGTVADPRIILKRALEKDALGIILCHNHPSGNLKPSRADEQITKKVKEAAGFFDIKLIDHIIVSEGGWFSFSDEGML